MTTSQNSNPVLPRANFGLKPTLAERFPASQPTPAPRRQAFDDELWLRLLTMELDEPGVAMPISKRLQAEHKWSAAQTDHAIFEYKRFLYLTQRAGFEVTPSRPVDLVWHEHLMHTKHYWNTLCRNVLQADLDHKPGTGGTGDDARLMAQYTRTLNAYRDAFRAEPPAEIWPKPTVRSASRATPAILAVALFAGLIVSVASRVWPLALVCGFGLFVALATYTNSANAKRKDRGGCGSGCGGGGIGSTGCADGGGSGDGGGGDGGGGCGGGGD